jgi:drug/metabolite transporter (DMT)-like permease
MSVVLGALAAIAAAALYSIGVTLQAIEARETDEECSLKPTLLKSLLQRKRWVAGTLCVAGGWTMQAVALLLAPITVVQPALALSVVGLLLIGVHWFGESVGKREIVSSAAIIVGVSGLAAVSPGQSDHHGSSAVLAIGMGALGLVAIVPYLLHAGGRRLGVLIVFSAGLAYAWTGFSTKFLADGLSSGAWPVGIIWLGATAAAAVVGLLSEMTALQERPPIEVFPIVLVVQIVVAVLLSPALAGQGWGANPAFVGILALSLVVLATGTRALCTARAVSRVVAHD